MSYEDLHPTNFNWHPAVRARVNWVQNHHPWKTYINTYWDHPPDLVHVPRWWPPGFYDKYSFDIWGGGGDSAKNYTGYRGKQLSRDLGDKIFRQLFHANTGPAIDWIIYRGKMFWAPATGGSGWTSAPPGPPDSDPDHIHHIHVTYQRG